MSYYDTDWSTRFNFGGPRDTQKLVGVCIHTTENDADTPCENVANYQLQSETGSYHVLVDSSGKRLRENTDNWITWSTGNKGNYILLHLSFVARAGWTRQQWLQHMPMLKAGATVAAHWCKEYNFPAKHVSVANLPGITTHNATRAWGSTDHTDPGRNFPWDVFIPLVNEAMGETGTAPETVKKKTPKTVITPAAPSKDPLTLILQQLAGPGVDSDGKPTFTGWPQLGNRTLVDAVAAILDHLKIDPKEGKKSA